MGLQSYFFLALFIILLWIKLSLRKYRPTAYWFVFTASAIVGTVISDFIDKTLGLGYTYGSAILLILLLLTLLLWYLIEKSLSVEKILTAKSCTSDLNVHYLNSTDCFLFTLLYSTIQINNCSHKCKL